MIKKIYRNTFLILLFTLLILCVLPKNSVEARTQLNFSTQDYEEEIGRERSNANQRRYPFKPNDIKISSPRLIKLSSGRFQLSYDFGYPISEGGASRFLEYRIKVSKELSNAISGINIVPIGAKVDNKPGRNNEHFNFSDRISFDSDGQKVFSSGAYLEDGYNGGEATINIRLNGTFINEKSYLSSYMLSDTEYNRPVWPSFQAVRNLNYNNFGKLYNSTLLKTEQQDANSIIQNEYSKIKKKLDNSNLSKKIKQQITNELNQIRKNYTNRINSQSKFENKTLSTIENLTNQSVKDMNNALNKTYSLSIINIPSLNFKEALIDSEKLLLETDSSQNVAVNYFSPNNSTASNWNISLSVSDLYFNNHALKASFLFKNQIYAPNTTFTFHNDKYTHNGNYSITKTPKEGVRLLVNPGIALNGTYSGKATWTISESPVS
ncbi:hypothetical protein R4Y45_00180 [Holzapfeliella sp. He02]|uniref:WxL domain-containing protein n=1 Tax=Holzapfeliella saturejae TaxID=3082953 RepID=A0ABU8SE55_9LACO